MCSATKIHTQHLNLTLKVHAHTMNAAICTHPERQTPHIGHKGTHMPQMLKSPNSVYALRDEASSSCLLSQLEWQSLHKRLDGCQSKRPSDQLQMAEASPGFAHSQLLSRLRHGLRHRHSAPHNCITHLLLFG